jgi:hypothetical protein
VTFERRDVSEELIDSIIGVTKIGELGTTSAVSSNQLLVTDNIASISLIVVSLMMEATRSSETSVLKRVTRRNISEDGILHSHRRENLRYLNSVLEISLFQGIIAA